MADAVVTLDADLSALRREVAKIPDAFDENTQKALIKFEKRVAQMQRTAKGLTKQLNKQGKEGGKGLENIADAAGDADSRIMGLAGGLDLVNPKMGDAAGVAGDFGAAVESVFLLIKGGNPLLIALSAAAAAAGAAYAVWADKQERHKRMVEASSAALETHRGLVSTLRDAQDALLVVLGKISEKEAQIRALRRASFLESMPLLQDITSEITLQQEEVRKAQEAYDKMAQRAASAEGKVSQLSGAMADPAAKVQLEAANRELKKQEKLLGGLDDRRSAVLDTAEDILTTRIKTVEVTHDQAEAEDRAATAAERVAEASAEEARLRGKMINQLQLQRDLMGELGAANQAQAEGVQDINKALADQEMAVLRAQATHDEALSRRLQAMAQEEALLRNLQIAAAAIGEQEIRINEEYERKLQLIDQLEEAGASRATLEAEATEAQIERERDLSELQLHHEDLHQAAINARIALEKQATEAQMLQAMNIGSTFSDMFGSIADSSMKAADLMSETNRDAALKAFNAYKVAAIAQAAIDAALAITNVWSEHAANPILAGVLTAVAAGATTVQIAAIASQEPSFHTGGIIGPSGGMMASSPDQVSTNVLPGEALLNRSAVALRGRESIERENRGEMPAMAVPFPVYRHFDRFARDEARRGGSFTRAIQRGVKTGRRGNF